MKLLLGLGLCVAMGLAGVASRRPKLVLLFAWVVLLTYNRQYFSFEGIAGDNSSQGPYWIVSDLFLFLLVALWVYEAAILKRVQRPRSLAVYPLFLPFAFAGAVSALGAERPDWSLYELIRAAKVVLVLFYIRYTFTKEEWWTCAGAMAVAVAFQSGLGIMEVVTQRSGLLGVLGLSSLPTDMPDELSQQNFYGWHRATGTMNHPPNLACYLLLAVPLPLAVALAPAPIRIRAAAAAVGVLGLVGLACTLSRWPWALAIGQAGLLLVALTWLRLLPVQHTLGLLSIGGLAAIIAILPFTDLIADRISRDLDRSLEFRENENRVALAMFADRPLLGVGPNNYKLYLAEHESEMVWALESEDLAVKTLKVRFIAAPQNGFLLPLAETGLAGLSAFLIYLAGVVAIGIRAIVACDGWHKAAALGLLTGIGGVIAQQVVDYSFWTDPVLFTFTLVAGMLAMAPQLCAPRSEGRMMRYRCESLLAVVAVGWLFACTPAATGSQAPATADGNLIVNPSFEDAGGDAPRGWTFESRASQKGKATTVKANAHAGDFSLKLEPNDKNRPWDIASHPLSVGQAYPAGPHRGKRLSFSGWLAADGPSTAVAAIYALRSDGGVSFVRLEQDSSKRGPVFHEDTFQVPDDSKVQYVIVNLAVEGTSGAAYFDDIRVSLGAPPQSRDVAAPRGDTLQQAEITVDASREIRRIPRTIYGSNLEWIWNANGAWDADERALNPDIVRLTRDAGFSLFRFPGGVFADFYHWQDGIGPQGSRRETPHTPGGPRSAHVFGTDEALAFAKATNSELLITVNAGTGTASEAADWVRYVNKGGGSGQRVTYWEIGNELYIKDPKFVTITPAAYLRQVVEFSRAMRAIDPTIKIAAISDENYPRTVQPAYRGWTEEVLRGAARDIDYLAVHNAYAPMLVADKGFDVRTVYAAMLAAPVLIKNSIDAAARKIAALDPETARRVKLAVTEWGPFFHFDVKNRFVDHVKTLGSALYAASVLKVLVESPAVEVANAFKLADPLFMGSIGLRDGKPAPTAPYFALQLYTRHFGERVVESVTRGPVYDGPAVGWVDRVADVPYLDVVASRSDDGKTLYVLAVNKHIDRPIVGRLALRGFTPAGSATAWTLNGTGIDANTGTRPIAAAGVPRQASDEPNGRFDRGGPSEVKLTSAAIDKVAATFEYTFPAHSVTSLEIEGEMMRVAITTRPTTWPHVRRGAERFCNELAAYLARRGHDVTIVSSKPGRREHRRDNGYTTVCARRLWHPLLGRAGILEFHLFALTALAHLVRGSYDVVLCSTFMDAYAATLARRLTGVACLFWVNGLPHRIRYVRSVTLRGAIFRRAIRRADEVVALSGYMQDDLRRRFGRGGRTIPVPVDTDRFQLSHDRDHQRPIILCAAALDDERKGGRLLMRAFDALKATRPEATLQICSAVSGETQAALLACVSPRWRGDVRFLGAGELADLPAVFGRAAISVLPSRWEPFGMVILESMATGTPVVATRDGAIPEIVTDPGVGRLFDPGPEGTVEPTNLSGLVDALVEGLELSRRPETADRCRAHAEQFSWSVVGPRFETLLAGLAARRAAVAQVAQAS